VFLVSRQIKFSPSGQPDETTVAVDGAIYRLESVDGDWEQVFPSGTSTTWRDFRCIAQSVGGEIMYVGTRGRSAGRGGVLKCRAGNPYGWIAIANEDASDLVFGFQAQTLYGWSAESSNYKLTDVRALAVHPTNDHIVYAGLACQGFLPQEGLWAYNIGESYQWEHLTGSSRICGQGVISLGINAETAPYQLVLGTSGMACFRGAVNDTTGDIQIEEDPPGDGLRVKLDWISFTGGKAALRFDLSQAGQVHLKIFDIQGRLVQVLKDDFYQAGQHQVVWNGRDDHYRSCASGFYFAKLKSQDVEVSKKFLILR
jgi:hypothetical protein